MIKITSDYGIIGAKDDHRSGSLPLHHPNIPQSLLRFLIMCLLLVPLLTACTPSDPPEVVKITKSNSTIECPNGVFNQGKKTELQLRSSSQQQLHNVTGSDCLVNGSIRTIGLARTGEGRKLRVSSRRDANHTARAQAAAPTDIHLKRFRIVADNQIPVYLGPGTTNFTLEDSVLDGISPVVAAYFDAESAHNTFDNVTVKTRTRREMLALDGSANNTFKQLTLKHPQKQAILLYRNCGEGGTVRHQTPSNNSFFDTTIFSDKPLEDLIIENSRNGNRDYCEDDAGFPWGSSASNADGGKNNVFRRTSVVK